MKQCGLSFWHLLTGSSLSLSSGGKNFLPLSSSSPLLPLSCPDTALHALTLPHFGKTSLTSLPGRVFSLGEDGLKGIPSLPPLADLPFFTALQGKKSLNCRDLCPHRSPGSCSPCLIPFHSPLSPPGSSLLPPLSDTAAPYCLYSYSFPLSPQLTAISRHAKLSEDTTDCLLRHPPWQQTSNHCLWQLNWTLTKGQPRKKPKFSTSKKGLNVKRHFST